MKWIGYVLLVVFAASRSAAAQDMTHVHQEASAAAAWTWRLDGNLFAGFNYQNRKFTDFHATESQNWFMATGSGAVGRGQLTVSSMFSLEALTMGGFGSPQVFQTGESYQGAALVDSQHPHDFAMNLGGRYDWTMGPARAYGGAYVVGEATFGPVVFMHRASAEDNPQVPLAHHLLDSTHITPGVLKGGIAGGPVTVEASWFHGREPDEHRWDLDLARLDSWAVRGVVDAGGWTVQASGGRFHQPEPNEFFEVTKLSASISRTADSPRGPIAATVAWGQDRGFYGVTMGVLAEAHWQPTADTAFYTRGEIVDKNILSAGFHSLAFQHPHIISRVGALTLGYRHDVGETFKLRVGIGGDVTGYSVPDNLLDPYGHPWSFHVFVRVRPVKGTDHSGHH